MDYATKCAEVVANVLASTRGKPDIEVQKSLTRNFPFHVNNLTAWKAYAAEIKKQSGRIMY